MCREHHQHSELFQEIYWILDEKYHPCPRWFVLSSTILLPSIQHKLVRVLCCTLISLLYSLWYVLPWSITKFYVKYVVRISPPRMTSWYGDTSPHHHSFLVPVLFLKGIPTNGQWGVNSKLLATLLLWSLLLIESSFEHWSCYLVQIPGYTLLSLFSCVCFPRAYIIISFDPTNDISLFT